MFCLEPLLDVLAGYFLSYFNILGGIPHPQKIRLWVAILLTETLREQELLGV
jgi:hypothetical protein